MDEDARLWDGVGGINGGEGARGSFGTIDLYVHEHSTTTSIVTVVRAFATTDGPAVLVAGF